jgi:MFS family permease
MAATERSSQPTYPYTAWNFVIIVFDASFFFAGLAFIDPVAVLPVLIDKLGGSEVTVGLMAAVQRAGWIIPQLLATSFVLHRRRKKPYIMWPVFLSRIPFCVLALVFNLPGAGDHVRSLLFLLIGIYAAFFFGDGLVGVPWQDIIARTIPPNLRGRFFGSMNVIGGGLILIAGAIVRRVLQEPTLPFPYNYGRLLIFLCVCMALSTFFLALMKEPRGSAMDEAQTIARIVRAIPATLRRYPLLFRVIVAQNILGFAGLAVPFYAVYGHSRLHLPESVGGLFIQVGIVGSVVASTAWALLNDRRGPLSVMRGVAVVGVFTPIAAILVPSLVRAFHLERDMVYFYSLAFLLNGAASGGSWMAYTNYILELAPDDIRPLFLGLASTLCSPVVIMPLIGGILLRLISFQVLFAIVALGSIVGLACVYRLPPAHRLAEGADLEAIPAPASPPQEHRF